MLRRLIFGGLAVLAAVALILAAPVIVVLAVAAPVFGLRRYRKTETAWAQTQAVGFSLQIGGSIWGLAPESWFGPGRGLERRSLWPSCLAVVIHSADYNGRTRTAFGVSIGSARLKRRTSGRFSLSEATGDLGWSFWHRPLRC
ncbi:hypothetical protein [Pseudophaeobacter sp.]|uniref:hypothetical protein n=1 Tax=Pseudophaeobacter sp. TaxID=1971739 RepID=UPI003A970586